METSLPPKQSPSEIFEVLLAEESDLPEIIDILTPAFAYFKYEALKYGPDSPAARRAAAAHHLTAWQQHARDFPSAGHCAIKCVLRHDSTLGPAGKIVGFAEWFLYDRPRSQLEVDTPNTLFDPAYLKPEYREEGAAFMDDVIQARRELVGARPHNLLVYMCVDPAWRRMGVSSLCVRWGMERCRELGVPGYLEASEEGKQVYGKLGWKVLADVQSGGMTFPAMIYLPEGVGWSSGR